MSNPVNDKRIVIITGDADSVSQAVIMKFAEEKNIVYYLHGEQKNKASFATLLSTQHENIQSMAMDITDKTAIEKCITKIYTKHQRIDVLINLCGGLQLPVGNEWDNLLDKSITGVMNLIKEVSPYMILNKYGRIINTASLLGYFGELSTVNYQAVKNGVIGIGKIWAQELSKYGITVNTIIPGYIDTGHTSEERMPKEIIKEKIPVKRMGTPEDMAHACLFLASEKSGFINGAQLNVDGGFSL